MTSPVRLNGGYYDAFRQAEFGFALDALEPQGDIVLDLGVTLHLDCSCLGLMVGKLHHWRQQQPEVNLDLRNVPQNLKRVLNLVQLDEVFVIDESACP